MFGASLTWFRSLIRTQDISGNPTSPAVLGSDNVFQWVLSSVGDRFGSYASVNGFIGNPGAYVDAVPEPGVLILMISAIAIVFGIRQR